MSKCWKEDFEAMKIHLHHAQYDDRDLIVSAKVDLPTVMRFAELLVEGVVQDAMDREEDNAVMRNAVLSWANQLWQQAKAEQEGK